MNIPKYGCTKCSLKAVTICKPSNFSFKTEKEGVIFSETDSRVWTKITRREISRFYQSARTLSNAQVSLKHALSWGLGHRCYSCKGKKKQETIETNSLNVHGTENRNRYMLAFHKIPGIFTGTSWW